MSLRHLIFHNFWLKIFSIGAGTIIWMAIHFSIHQDLALTEPASSQRLIRQTLSVPISIVQQEGDTRNFKLNPTNALVTVFGEARLLKGPEGKEIKMIVDLSDYHSTTLSQEDLRPDAPPNITIVEFKPHTVTVEPAGP